MRLLIGIVAVLLVVAGILAVFREDSEVGAAALLASGAVFTLVAYAGNRITRLKAGQFEADLEIAAVQFRVADKLEAAGSPDAAAQMRDQALSTLQELNVISAEYEDTRQRMPSGPERTRAP